MFFALQSPWGARPIIKLIQYILSRKVQSNSWQALIKPWDGFCGPLEVRTHPLPPPDSGASFSSFRVFVFEISVLRFRSRVLRFRDLGASCFGLRFRVLRFRNYRTGLRRFVQHHDWLHCMLEKKSKNFLRFPVNTQEWYTYVFWCHWSSVTPISNGWVTTVLSIGSVKECFHMTSRRPYWCLKQWKGGYVGVPN